MIKKIFPFILSIILLISLIGFPYLIFNYQEHSLLNQSVVEDIKQTDNQYSNSNTLDRIKFISNCIPSAYNELTDSEYYTFYWKLQNDQLKKIYNESKKLFELDGQSAPTYDDIKNYYDCTLVSFGTRSIINLYIISFNIEESNTQVRVWLDSLTYKIYVLRIVNKTKNVSFSQEHFMKYLGISEEDFSSYYVYYNEGKYLIYDICKETNNQSSNE